MNDEWKILYRGPLSSCNYACTYCPFAKTRNSRAELEDDARKLERFVDWVESRTETIGVLFTPWGEALIRKHYQHAFRRLSHMEHVSRVAAQTNLSCRLDWLSECDLEKVALWTTYHPTQASFDSFVAKCRELDTLGARYSVGVVGFKDALDQIRQMREALQPTTYLWINAYKRDPDYYDEADIRAFERIDPHFRTNMTYHPSRGASCRAGWSTFSVHGDGVATRCHFIKDPLGSIYEPGFEAKLSRKPCTNESCGCHIGYVHMDRLRQEEVYGPNILERIPKEFSRSLLEIPPH